MSQTETGPLDVKNTAQWCEICGYAVITTTVDGREHSRSDGYKPKIYQDWRKANGLLPVKECAYCKKEAESLKEVDYLDRFEVQKLKVCPSCEKKVEANNRDFRN